MRIPHLLVASAIALVPASAVAATQTPAAPACPADPSVGPGDLFVITARGFRCGTSGAIFGPYRQYSRLNFGRSSTAGPFDHGRSATLLVEPTAWQRELDARVHAEGPPIIYIHGYNNSQDVAVRRARAISALLAKPRPVIAITWPSYADPTIISGDEVNNEWAREPLGTQIASLVRRYKGTALIAHSMGNRILLDTLARNPDILSNIGLVVAAAPDVDEDQFMRHMQAGYAFGVPTTIYTSRKDQPLATSWRIHRMRRAGDLSSTAGNRVLWIRYPDLDRAVTVVDLTDTTGDWLGHSNFIQSVAGAADLCRLLNPAFTPGGRAVVRQPSYYSISDQSAPSDDCTRLARTAARIDKGLQ